MKSVAGFPYRLVVPLMMAALVFSGCSVRSISDSGYRKESGYRTESASNPFYKGELSEFEILGINAETKITQDEISRSFESKQRLALQKGTPVLLI